MKKLIAIATAITVAIMIACAYALPADADELCPVLTVVIDTERVDAAVREIICQDRAGMIWSFYADDTDWGEGDVVILLMWHDEVIDAYWEGYTENIVSFFDCVGWR